jgi:molybdate transport system regulatory protein
LAGDNSVVPKTPFKSLQPRIKVWLELGGQPVFGDGKCRWLEVLDRTGSLRATAAELGMSYRGLWGRLRGMEERLGVALVARRTGGPGGGGVDLTPAGRALVSAYRCFHKGLEDLVEQRFRKCLPIKSLLRQNPASHPARSKASRRRK